MPIRKDLYEQQMHDREAEAVDADRANRRTQILTVAVCLFWCAVGGAVMAWGVMTHDAAAGRTALSAGAQIATVGTIFTLLYVYRRAEQRGDR